MIWVQYFLHICLDHHWEDYQQYVIFSLNLLLPYSVLVIQLLFYTFCQWQIFIHVFKWILLCRISHINLSGRIGGTVMLSIIIFSDYFLPFHFHYCIMLANIIYFLYMHILSSLSLFCKLIALFFHVFLLRPSLWFSYWFIYDSF